MLRNILILTLGLAVPFTFGVACNDDDDKGDDKGDGNDDGNDDNDDDNDDDSSQAECESPADCDIIHCNCESGVVNYSACNFGQCGTADDCAGVCQEQDTPDDEGGSEGGSDTDW